MEENKPEEKNVLFLCKCNSNISDTVNFNKLVKWAKANDDINTIAVSNLLCSPDGKDFFSKVIKEKNAKNIIIGACSPKIHEKTFQYLADKEDINFCKVQMANIREQCAWITTDKNEATEKAKSMINGIIKRTLLSEDLPKRKMKVHSDVVIIGGGIAGIKAALMLSSSERKVYLIEKEISIGGSIMKSEDIAPNMECSPCMAAPLLSEIRDDPNIEVIAFAEVTEIIGFFGNFTLKVKQKARFVEDNCIACEECFNVCPVETENQFHHGLGKRKAIYTLFPGSEPAAAVIDKEICKHFTDNSCNECVGVCPFTSINFEQEDKETVIQAGSVILATGFKSGDISKFDEFGYGQIDNVYTTPEIESLASTNGPTGGKIRLKNGNLPSNVAVIHCAGSKRPDGIPYCSSICCTHAVKVGDLIRKNNPDARVYNIHDDIVYSNPKEYNFHIKQKEAGTQFIECKDLTSIKLEKAAGSEEINISGTGIETLNVDMAVLATGLQPSASTKVLAGMLSIDLDEHGYMKPDHEILNSTESALDGVYVTGCALMPSNVANTCTQSQAVAGDIMSKLIPGQEIDLEPMTSIIDEERCAGCKLCISSCPYTAITYNPETKVSFINEAICRGCGTCTVTCPSNASSAKNFRDDQIIAEIKGILNVKI